MPPPKASRPATAQTASEPRKVVPHPGENTFDAIKIEGKAQTRDRGTVDNNGVEGRRLGAAIRADPTGGLAVTEQQISDWRLPSRPTKTSDTGAKCFGNLSVKLDAVSSSRLRALVQRAIEQHLPPERFAVVKTAERNEQKLIHGLVGMLKSQTGWPP